MPGTGKLYIWNNTCWTFLVGKVYNQPKWQLWQQTWAPAVTTMRRKRFLRLVKVVERFPVFPVVSQIFSNIKTISKTAKHFNNLFCIHSCNLITYDHFAQLHICHALTQLKQMFQGFPFQCCISYVGRLHKDHLVRRVRRPTTIWKKNSRRAGPCGAI